MAWKHGLWGKINIYTQTFFNFLALFVTNTIQLYIYTTKGPFLMLPNDFRAFRCLMQKVYTKAFGATALTLNFAESRALSWLIYEKTGELISYKSLINYSKAIHLNHPESLNPSANTLGILAHFVGIEAAEAPVATAPKAILWYHFRKLTFQDNINAV